MFANGTGIAPLLGMAYENHERKPLDIFWGAKFPESFKLFKDVVNELIDDERLSDFHTAYSRSDKHEKKYVQNLIFEKKHEIAKSVTDRTYIMICGSVDMGNVVIKNLSEILTEHKKPDIKYFIDNHQLKIDTY